MSIQLRCANLSCAATLKMPDGAVGKEVRCPLCGHLQPIPRPRPPAEASGDLSQAVTDEPIPPAEEILDVLPVPRDEVSRKSAQRWQEEEDDLPSRRWDRFQDGSCPFCEARVAADARRCRSCGRNIDADHLERVFQGLSRRRALYRLLFLLFGGSGIPVLVVGGLVLLLTDFPALGGVILLVGFVLCCVGVYCAASYKAHKEIGFIVMVLGIFGLLVLAFVPDENAAVLDRIRRRLRGRFALDD